MTGHQSLKILIVNRPTVNVISGGDVTQVLETAKALRALGHTVDLSNDIKPEVRPYDLIHFFNLETPFSTLIQIRQAKLFNKPVYLSPIFSHFSNLNSFNSFYEYGNYYSIKKLLPRFVNYKIFNYLYQRERRAKLKALELVDHLLPNSELEFQQLQTEFSVNLPPYNVVVNGINPESFKDPEPNIFVKKYGFEDFVLEVSRVNSIKNQMNLIRAMRGLDIPLVIIGSLSNKIYADLCRQESKSLKKILFIDRIDQAMLKHAYAAAKVHVLPSFKETCGLVSLEAGLCGCNIVASLEGCQRAYTLNFAEYCHPENPASIRHAILRAFNKPKNNNFSNYIKQNYTWEHAALQTEEAYYKSLDR